MRGSPGPSHRTVTRVGHSPTARQDKCTLPLWATLHRHAAGKQHLATFFLFDFDGVAVRKLLTVSCACCAFAAGHLPRSAVPSKFLHATAASHAQCPSAARPPIVRFLFLVLGKRNVRVMPTISQPEESGCSARCSSHDNILAIKEET